MSQSIHIRLVHANARLTVNQQAAAGILDTSTNQSQSKLGIDPDQQQLPAIARQPGELDS